MRPNRWKRICVEMRSERGERGSERRWSGGGWGANSPHPAAPRPLPQISTHRHLGLDDQGAARRRARPRGGLLRERGSGVECGGVRGSPERRPGGATHARTHGGVLTGGRTARAGGRIGQVLMCGWVSRHPSWSRLQARAGPGPGARRGHCMLPPPPPLATRSSPFSPSLLPRARAPLGLTSTPHAPSAAPSGPGERTGRTFEAGCACVGVCVSPKEEMKVTSEPREP